MKKRVLIFALVCAMIFSIAAIIANADSSNAFSVTISETGSGTNQVTVGETYEFKVGISSIDPSKGGLTSISMTMYFPSGIFEYVEGSFTPNPNAPVSDWTFTCVDGSASKGSLTFTIVGASTSAGVWQNNFLYFTLKFKVLPTYDTSANLTIPYATGTQAVDSAHATGATFPLVLNIVKSEQEAPKVPNVVFKTYDSVLLEAVEGCEYSIDGIKFQSSTQFSGLSANTEYTFYQRLKATDTLKESPVSEGLVVKTYKRMGLGIDAPTVEDSNISANRVVLNVTEGCEYSCDNGITYQSSPTFTRLYPNTTYYFVQRLKETDTTEAGAKSSILEITTPGKGNEYQPSAPTALFIKDTYVILESTSGFEYSTDGENWTDNNVFDGLTQNTEYSFYQRVKATYDTAESSSSEATIVTTSKSSGNTPIAVPTVESYADGVLTITAVEGFEYSIDGGETWQDSNVFEDLEPYQQYYLTQRVAETDISTHSEDSKIVVYTTSKLSNAQVPDSITIVGTTDSTILVSSYAMYEYSLDGVSWQDSPLFGNLTCNTEYTVYERIRATYVSEASDSISVTVKTDKQAPSDASSVVISEVTSTSITIDTTSLEGYEYSIDGVNYVESYVFNGLESNATYTIYQRIKETEDTKASEPTYALVTTNKAINDTVPEKPKALSDPTQTQIVLLPIFGYEYSIDGGVTWTDNNIFDELEINKTYYFVQRIKETDTKEASAISESTELSTIKYSNNQVAVKPVVKEVGETSIELVAVEGYEYRLANGTFQDSPLFTGLTSSTEYFFEQRIKETETVYASKSSDVTRQKTLSQPYEGEVASPELVSKTNNTITLKSVAGYEYKLENGEWQSSTTFTNLEAATTYKLYQRVAETQTTYASEPSQALEVTTDKNPAPAAPENGPTINSYTDTSITVESVEGYEYSIDNGTTWQSSNVFTNLTASTEYTIIQRVAETSSTLASLSSTGTSVKTYAMTPSAPSAPTISAYTNTTVTLVPIVGYEYSLDKENWQTGNMFVNLNVYTQYTFYQRVAQTADTPASPASRGTTQRTDKNDGPEAPDQPRLSVMGNVVVILRTVGYEYSYNLRTWTTSNLFTLDYATDYKIYQRVAETEDTKASAPSPATEITTDKYYPTTPDAPTLASYTTTSITLKRIDGGEYSIDGVNWQDNVLFSGLVTNRSYTFYQRIKETSTSYQSEISEGATFTPQEPPIQVATPILREIKAYSIVFFVMNGYEYSIDGGLTYQSNPSFVVTPNTVYSICQRIAATETSNASPSSIVSTIRTPSDDCQHPTTHEVINDPTCFADGLLTVICDVCGKEVNSFTLPRLEHDFNWEVSKAATCSEEGSERYICKNCGSVSDVREIEKLPHTPGEWQNLNDEFEVKYCTVCGELVDIKSIGQGTETSESTAHEHLFVEWTYVDDNTHVGTCSCGETETANHTWDEGVIIAEPTHTAYGVKLYVCTICHGQKLEQIDKIPGHTFTSWSSDGEKTHSRVCDCGEKETEQHSWDEGIVTKEATHLVDGEKTFTCTICGATMKETIQKTQEHTFLNWVSDGSETHSRACACGEIEIEYHSWDEGIVTKEATHLEEGEKIFTCNVCGEVKKEAIKKTSEHTFSDWSSDGEKTHSRACECGEFEAEQHTWDEGIVTKEATHLEEGEKTFTCLVCGETYKEEISKTPEHTFSNWSSDDEATHSRVCACGEIEVEDHKWDTGKIIKEPTQAAEGTKAYTCLVCGEVSLETIAKLPSIVEADNTWKQDSNEGLTVKSSAELSDFISVYVDGLIVTRSNYDLYEGSTIVVLHADYLARLTVGTHTIRINSTTGSAESTFEVQPKEETTTHQTETETTKVEETTTTTEVSTTTEVVIDVETTTSTSEKNETPTGKVSVGLIVFMAILAVILALIIAFIIWYIINDKKRKFDE